MSGAKFVIPMLAADVLLAITLSNEEKFRQSGLLRADAAEQERQSRMAESRDALLVEMRDAYVLLREREALGPQEAARLQRVCDTIRIGIDTASTDRELREAADRIPGLVVELRRAVAQHRDRAAWESRRTEEEEDRRLRAERLARQHAATELYALAAGLRADPMLMRWHAQGVEKLREAAAAAIQSGQAVEHLAEARARAETMEKEAKAAQLQADQRDYIARGIMQSLAGMGFLVTDPAAEHPEHPATAMIVRAASAAGKSIAVSVPVEGEVWYEIDGYLKTTEATVGGGTSVACDEGEQVLTEMHERLNAEFHVETGEIWWDEKDPQRRLRRAESLPSAAGAHGRERAG